LSLDEFTLWRAQAERIAQRLHPDDA